MAVDPAVLAAIRSAVEAEPANAALRTHLAGLLLEDGRAEEARREAAIVLSAEPDHLAALEVAAEASRALGDDGRARASERPVAGLGSEPPAPIGGGESLTVDDLLELWNETAALEEPEVGQLLRPTVRLDDVGGLEDVKARLDRSFLAPLRNPELGIRFGKSLRGGLLLWGPPGCGKTFIARAVAGELGASFYEVGIADVLDMWIGSSERNLHSVFEVARRSRPCVLFFDEIDALGHKRTQMRGGGAAMRGVVNQLLTELDGVSNSNEGVFVLAATNHPWDVDPAIIRPGRLDRMVLVLPPDTAARVAILASNLRGRPVGRIDLAKIAKATDGWSGADLALLCESATEHALADSIESGTVRDIEQRDFERAVRTQRPSIGSWLETAKNFATYADGVGDYDDLLRYLKTRR